MIRLDNIHFSYSDSPFIEELDLHIRKGEILTIIGPNGSGKSTVIKNISRKLSFQKGTIFLDSEDIRNMTPKEIAVQMASLSQHQGSPMDFTVEQLIYYGRLPHKKWYETMNRKDRKAIDEAMERTGVIELKDKPVMMLSGGERQRVWIAMTLAQDPKILLLDEPTTYLDICHQLEVLDLIKELNLEMDMTIVMVLHDLNQACQYSDRVVVMKEGKIDCMGKPCQVFTSEMLERVYNVEAKVSNDEFDCVHIRPLKVCRKKTGVCKAC